MKCTRLVHLSFIIAAFCTASRGQDSVDVTFRYTNPSATGVTLVGEFTGWNNSLWPMTPQGGGLWTRTVRLLMGGNPNPAAGKTPPGSWQYKFYYTGASSWPNDPLNHHVNPADNDNTFVYTRDPTLYQVLPNQRLPVLTTAAPTITSYIFPGVGATVDTSSIRLVIDGTTIAGLGAFYDTLTRRLSYPLAAPLVNGSHTMIIRASSSAGGSSADTVTFYTQGGYVQISNPGGYATRTSQRTLYGLVQGSGVAQVKMVRNKTDTTSWPVSSGKFTATVFLVEGANTFRALADSSGTQVASSPVSFTRLVNHLPNALISFYEHGSIDLKATGSTSPDSGQTLKFIWGEDPANPSVIGGINGNTSPVITVNRPSVQGEYYFSLIATDTSGNSDTTRNYFTLGPTPPIVIPTIASVPRWVREGRMYTMFFKMHTQAGTINAALPDLNRIAAMGYNILWVLPVMKNRDPINNGPGPGYNIVDFTTVAPEYGTNQDMKSFIDRAHALGMKVILDITPNHTSSSHPFVLDARTFGAASQYWTYYQHQFLGTGNMSQAMTSDGFVYYGGFSDALLNYNWADIDARAYMIDVYKYWVRQAGADGYRFDVYWGPHSRANGGSGGEGEMGVPVRSALKHIRPDIAILGETAGTGVGTEVNYVDQGGGIDEGYDWNLKGYVQSNIWSLDPAARVNNLDGNLRNGSATLGMGYLPGPNSYFLRFLENQDEERIAYVYTAGGTADAATARARTMPVSTAVTLAVGLPQVYAGEEVGRGPGIADYDARRRGVIDFTDPAGVILMPHYQKLAQIKKQYPCFSTQSMYRAETDVPGVYAYTRPYQGANGVVVANIDGAQHDARIILSTSGNPGPLVGFSDGAAYVATDLYNNTTHPVVFTAGIDTLKVSLPAYGSAVFVIDNVSHTLILPSLTGIVGGRSGALPREYGLDQNYPNPFNPATTIRYQITSAGHVTLRVYDILGREVGTLTDEFQAAGSYTKSFDASRLSTGVYFYRLQAGSFVNTKKMVLSK